MRLWLCGPPECRRCVFVSRLVFYAGLACIDGLKSDLLCVWFPVAGNLQYVGGRLRAIFYVRVALSVVPAQAGIHAWMFLFGFLLRGSLRDGLKSDRMRGGSFWG